uniref:Myb/SANT-like domain-containing protein n=1 Tax=Oryza brachyantha TaxID=4533 RepID=J3M533_ORYBR
MAPVLILENRICGTYESEPNIANSAIGISEVSAWLNNSIDPIEGNARKGNTYWSKVAEAYNETTPNERKRDMNHLKGHWHKTTKKVSLFNGCYIQLHDAYASGHSNGQLMELALEFYRTH